MEMVINAVHYNPILTLQILESKGWTNRFFSLWFGSMNSFTRVHDKKLCIVAISSLLSINPEQVPASVSVGWPRLLQGITELFRTLPVAIKSELFPPSSSQPDAILTPLQIGMKRYVMTSAWRQEAMTMPMTRSGVMTMPTGPQRTSRRRKSQRMHAMRTLPIWTF